jgi:hypothetical protein
VSLAHFREAWALDFEFRQPAGERPAVRCMTALGLHSGRALRLWLEGAAPPPCPFDTGPDALFVAFMATAEMGCFLSLNWPLPARVIDLYVEFKREICGKDGEPLYPALTYALDRLGLAGLDVEEKGRMRDLAMRDGAYTGEERRALLDYCWLDTDAAARLLRAMLPRIDWPRAVIRGEFVKAAAHVEHNGIPMDVGTLRLLDQHWEDLQDDLVRQLDADYGVYDGIHFRGERFARLVRDRGIDWPRLPTGGLSLDDETFKDMSEVHPWLRPLRQLRQALAKLRLTDLPIGKDGRNRCMLSPFGSTTGRCTPHASKYLFCHPAWMRSLAMPPEGRALLYFDWSAQEPGLSAVLSRDAAMWADYDAGDIYLGFARRIGLVPHWATKKSHEAERELVKVVFLAVGYGMGEQALARKIGKPAAYARHLLGAYRRAYPRFTAWADGAVRHALFRGRLWTRFGWQTGVRYRHPRRPNDTDPNGASLANFCSQGNGAELLRLAAGYVCDAGLMLDATVHDAVLVECEAADIEATAQVVRGAMNRASREVLYGAELKTSCLTVRWPDRYSDTKGAEFWGRLMEALDRVGGWAADGTPTVPSAAQGCTVCGPPVQIQFY